MSYLFSVSAVGYGFSARFLGSDRQFHVIPYMGVCKPVSVKLRPRFPVEHACISDKLYV